MRSLRDLYPQLDEKELRIAKENYRRYAALLVRIYTRHVHGRNKDSHLRPLTDKRKDATTDTRPRDESTSD